MTYDPAQVLEMKALIAQLGSQDFPPALQPLNDLLKEASEIMEQVYDDYLNAFGDEKKKAFERLEHVVKLLGEIKDCMMKMVEK